MNVELLQEAISDKLENIPIGLHWKMISQGLQGAIPKNLQVKALQSWRDPHNMIDSIVVSFHHQLIAMKIE